MPPTISNILVATNLSKSASCALRHAVSIAVATDAKIHIVHVCEELSEDAKVTMMLFMQDDASRKKALSKRTEIYKAALADHLEQFWESMNESDRAARKRVVSASVIEGFPAEIILSQADDHSCDLIVLGAHEHGFNHTFVGNVAKRVLRRSQIPTLVVPLRED